MQLTAEDARALAHALAIVAYYGPPALPAEAIPWARELCDQALAETYPDGEPGDTSRIAALRRKLGA